MKKEFIESVNPMTGLLTGLRFNDDTQSMEEIKYDRHKQAYFLLAAGVFYDNMPAPEFENTYTMLLSDSIYNPDTIRKLIKITNKNLLTIKK